MKAIVRTRKICFNGKVVKTVVETVCAKCGTVMNGVSPKCLICKEDIEIK